MNIVIGLILAFIGGAIQGAFVFPMKFLRQWRWENGWFVFTLVCCLLFPAALAFGTTPGLLDIYHAVGLKTVGLVFLFGLGWGVGVVLFGLGAEYLGMALGIAIITGINVCLGAVFPILFLRSGQFSPKAALTLGAGLLVMMVGVAVISVAGKLRERDCAGRKVTETTRPKVSFKVGLLVCIVAGFFCPSTNFAVFFGQPITEAVKGLGTVAPYHLGHAQMLPFFLGGWLVNTGYCVYLLRKNGSFAAFFSFEPLKNGLKAAAMAVLFMVGMVLYLVATSVYIPAIGAIVGWPVFMAATMMCSNALGIFSGEYRGCRPRTFLWLYGGLALLVAAVAIASLSNLYLPK